jgi:hypothetical protein
MMDPKDAAVAVRKGLEAIADYAKAIPADPGFRNKFADGEEYKYGRATLAPIFYSFGTPPSREVGVSSALRMRGKPNVIIFGTRNEVDFGADVIDQMSKAQPAEKINPGEIFTGRPRTTPARYDFDLGPGEKWARTMKENLDLEKIFAPKSGKTYEKDGIAALNVKNTSDHGDFGHYRGSFENARVLVLADPDGADDLITSRALTGARGQYLQGLMNDLGVGKDYLVIKTVPFIMDGADQSEWATVLSQTGKYRDAILGELLQKKYDLILTDGPFAQAEMIRLMKGHAVNNLVSIQRNGLGNNSGIVEAGASISALSAFKGAHVSGERANIPRPHLTFYAHVWEGTSGDSVVGAKDQGRGLAYAIVAPNWAFKQKVQLDDITAKSVNDLKLHLQNSGLMMPGESVSDFMKRKEATAGKKKAS